MKKFLLAWLCLAVGCTACSTSVPGTPAPLDPATPLTELLLQGPDLPEGAKQHEIKTMADLESAGEDDDESDDREVSPPECGADGKPDIDPEVEVAAISADLRESVKFSQEILRPGVDLTEVRAGVSGACAHVTVRSGTGVAIESEADYELLDVPRGRDPRNVVVVRGIVSVKLLGTPAEPLDLTHYLGFANVRGMLVTVVLRSDDSVETVDQDEFDELFSAAIRKVETAE